MTYRVEITADSLRELAGKLAEMASQMNAPAGGPVTNKISHNDLKAGAQTQNPYAQTAGNVALSEEDLLRQASAVQGGVVRSVKAAKSTEALVEPQTAIDAQDMGVEAEPTEEQSSDNPEPTPLVYEKDVAPLVIALVGAKGKPAAMAVLEAFGVANAKEVPADQWPALVAALNEAQGG